jgi:hypothetical protein
MISYIEIIKYLEKNRYAANPPKFNKLLERFESFDPLFNQDEFLSEDDNSKLFLSYLFVKFNWVIHQVIMGDPDLVELSNLLIQLESIKDKYSRPITNYYINALYVLLSSISMYYADKSNESLSEYVKSMGSIISQTAEWWTHDYNEEYMRSVAPQKILDMKADISHQKCSDKFCQDCGEK